MKCYLVDFVFDSDALGFEQHYYYIFSSYEKAKHCILYLYHYYMTHDPDFAEDWESEQEANLKFEEEGGIYGFAYIYDLDMNPVYKPNNF